MKFYWYFFSICILFSFSSYAQFTSGGIAAHGGFSYISYSAKEISNISTSNKAMLSFQTGVFATYRLTKKSGLEAEFNYLLQRGEFEIYFDNSVGASINEGTAMFTTKITYLTLPVRYTYNIRHFTFMGGIQTGVALYSNTYEYGVAYGSDTTYYWSNDYPDDNIKTVDLGISLGGQENISDRLFVALTVYHSLFDIIQDNPMEITRRNTNILAGVGYRLFATKSKERSH